MTYGIKWKTMASQLMLAQAQAKPDRRDAWIKEFEANTFAEELLMPEDMLLERFKTIFVRMGFDVPMTCRILAKMFGVEYFLIVRRLTRLKAI